KQAIAPQLVLVDATIPDALVATLRGALPPGWDDVPDSGAARPVGDSWLQGGSSLALEVPSVHSSIETNVLINHAHPDFAQLVIGNPVPFAFDRRLIDPSLRGGEPRCLIVFKEWGNRHCSSATPGQTSRRWYKHPPAGADDEAVAPAGRASR